MVLIVCGCFGDKVGLVLGLVVGFDWVGIAFVRMELRIVDIFSSKLCIKSHQIKIKESTPIATYKMIPNTILF